MLTPGDPQWLLHLLMRGQRLKVTAEGVEPWLHPSQDGHTLSLKNFHSRVFSLVSASRLFLCLKTKHVSQLPHFHQHKCTHTHTGQRALTYLTVWSVSFRSGLNSLVSQFNMLQLSLIFLCRHYRLPLAHTHAHTS